MKHSMKNKWIRIKKYMPWLMLFIVRDFFFCMLLWIADVQVWRALSVTIVLLSLLLFLAVLCGVVRHEKQYQDAFRNYIDLPTEVNAETLYGLSKDADQDGIQLLGNTLRENQLKNDQLVSQIMDYEEYVESWAHETKTPISLLTILLDNHRNEIPENLSRKLDYIRNRLQEDVNQMLFYARLKGEKKDYLLEEICLSQCIADILEDYQPLLEEKCFVIHKEHLDVTVFSDKRGLQFLLSQIISNSIKYVKKEASPKLEMQYILGEKANTLVIKDNGIGVKECDLPYIFEKGFTGDSGESRKKATGMGLYLVKEMAEDLKLKLDVKSEWMHGFEIRIIFPKIHQT